ncbi:glycosyltransferase family 4 protein [Vibrio hannami]|uniref:glycosyltransferase family 4 protein n=1 Tax=Vibrio hannami TaxID=2717094 RepID=UPI00240F9F92|nr:glycosyltransferase family 4 protein [Vibrio hannami]MDG3088282.1 glycosyltransferase family 4 protein [Vibrio hannami]
MNDSILIFSDEYPPNGGGTGTVAHKLVRDFSLNNKEVTLLTGDRSKQEEGIRHIQVPRYTFVWVLYYYYYLKIVINLHKYDFIILNDQVSAYLAGRFFDDDTLSKCVMIIHGKDSKFFYSNKSKKHFVFNYKSNYTRAISKVGKIVAVSEYNYNEFLNYLPLDIKENVIPRLSADYVGIDSSELKGGEDHTHVFKRLKNKIILLSVGRIIKSKGYFKMLSEFNKLVQLNNMYHWIIVGDGADLPLLESRISELQLSDNITIVGKIPRKSLGYFYKSSDCFWLLSEIEAFGLVYIEAAAFGLPSISPKAGGGSEAVIEGKSGYHYDETDDLPEMINRCIALKSNSSPVEVSKMFKTEMFAERLLKRG